MRINTRRINKPGGLQVSGLWEIKCGIKAISLDYIAMGVISTQWS